MPTALVTGSRGFIGGHLVQRLLESGARVRCLVRNESGAAPPAGAEPVPGNYTTGTGLRDACDGVDIVFHLAGVTKALRSSDYEEGNVRAAERMARAAESVPRFVLVSSLAAVGPSPDSIDLSEEAEPHPVSQYGRSKLAGERMVRRLLPDAVIVRPPVVYGPRDTDVFEMLHVIARGIDLRIGRGERWFSSIFVRDLVDGLLAAAQCPVAAGKAYFLAHPEPVSWTQFTAIASGILGGHPRAVVLPRAAAWAVGCMAEAWSRAAHKPGIISRDKIREAVYPRWTCSPERARRELPFSAATSIEMGLAAAIAWYRKEGWL
jgi:nucleoside-diphosphate-sugar epimerase